MLTFDAGAILKAVTALRQIESIIRNFDDNDETATKKSDPVSPNNSQTIIRCLDEMTDALAGLQMKTTHLTVSELRPLLNAKKKKISYKAVADWMQDIGVTLRRELNLAKTFLYRAKERDLFSVRFRGNWGEFRDCVSRRNL